MKIFYSPFHTFIHKVLVTTHEAGLWDAVEFVPTYPFQNRAGEDQGNAYSIAALNPLDKVPTLALDDGTVVYGSQAMAECLDAMGTSGHRLFPPEGPARWDAITRLALADTMFETTVMMVMEGWQPEEQQRLEFFEWIWPKIIRGLDTLEARTRQGFESFDIGQAATLHALSYIRFRTEFYDAKDPIYPEFLWAEGRPNLKAWWDEAIQRPSVTCHYMKDFEGDDSPEFCQAKVQEVLAAQRANR
jgi:glutathione S-transferase